MLFRSCLVVMKSGHAIVYGFSQNSRRASAAMEPMDEVTVLTTIAANENTFQPTLLVDNRWGVLTAFELSNIGACYVFSWTENQCVSPGFLALAYGSGALLIIDMRKSSVILRDGIDERSKKRHSIGLLNSSDGRRIQSLRWFVCGIDDGNSLSTSFLSD